jgi:hypothetical protein
MAAGSTTITPDMRVTIGIEPALRTDLASRAAGRVLVIDYWASRRCGVVTGDLTARFSDRDVNGSYVEGAPIEGVRIVVEERLLDVLEQSQPTLRLTGPTFRRRLGMELARPELWLDFLDGPGVVHGKLWG